MEPDTTHYQKILCASTGTIRRSSNPKILCALPYAIFAVLIVSASATDFNCPTCKGSLKLPSAEYAAIHESIMNSTTVQRLNNVPRHVIAELMKFSHPCKTCNGRGTVEPNAVEMTGGCRREFQRLNGIYRRRDHSDFEIGHPWPGGRSYTKEDWFKETAGKPWFVKVDNSDPYANAACIFYRHCSDIECGWFICIGWPTVCDRYISDDEEEREAHVRSLFPPREGWSGDALVCNRIYVLVEDRGRPDPANSEESDPTNSGEESDTANLSEEDQEDNSGYMYGCVVC